MSTFSKEILSGSTNGRGVKVAATATPGTLVHTAVSGTVSKDEVFIYLYNSHTADVEVTVEWGGVTDPDDHIVLTVAKDDGLYLAVPGLIIQNALEVRVFAAVINVVVASGYVNRIAG